MKPLDSQVQPKRQISAELRRRVLDLRRSHSLSKVSALTGLPLGTVKTLVSRSGAFRDNQQHRAMFTLPPIKASATTALAVPELPPQQVVTGDKEIDAVLWLHQVIKTGQASLIEKAMKAAARIKTPLKDVEKRYMTYLAKTYPGNFGAMLSSLGFADLEDMASRAVEKKAHQQEAHARFGDALFTNTAAEDFCEEVLSGLDTCKMGWSLDKKQVDSRLEKHPDLLPQTLTDCLYELKFWRDLYWLRNAGDGSCDHSMEAQARDDFAFRRMALLRARTPDEAIAVFRYMAEHEYMDRTETNDILLNLIAPGSHITGDVGRSTHG